MKKKNQKSAEVIDMYSKLLDGKTFKIGDEVVEISTNRYSDGNRVAIRLVCTEGEDKGMPYCTLTVNIPEVTLLPGEIIIKSWEENEYAAEAAKSSGLFNDTGKRVRTGYVQAEIWEILK